MRQLLLWMNVHIYYTISFDLSNAMHLLETAMKEREKEGNT